LLTLYHQAKTPANKVDMPMRARLAVAWFRGVEDTAGMGLRVLVAAVEVLGAFIEASPFARLYLRVLVGTAEVLGTFMRAWPFARGVRVLVGAAEGPDMFAAVPPLVSVAPALGAPKTGIKGKDPITLLLVPQAGQGV
jgi:hypothetical protein